MITFQRSPYFNILLFSFLAAVLVAVGLISSKFTKTEAQASPQCNVSGWAWSDTIGWINFNNIDDLTVGGDGKYCVSVDTNGELYGSAWSDNIGWIKFGGLSGFPTGDGNDGTIGVAAKLIGTGTTRNIEGWARACAGTSSGDCTVMTPRTDGWDGWISFRGTNPNYGVTYDATDPNNKALKGYAWGGEVVGWISFNCLTDPKCSPAKDYKVAVDLSIIPTCPGGPGCPTGPTGSDGGLDGVATVTISLSAAPTSPPYFLPPGTTTDLTYSTNIASNFTECRAVSEPLSSNWSEPFSSFSLFPNKTSQTKTNVIVSSKPFESATKFKIICKDNENKEFVSNTALVLPQRIEPLLIPSFDSSAKTLTWSVEYGWKCAGIDNNNAVWPTLSSIFPASPGPETITKIIDLKEGVNNFDLTCNSLDDTLTKTQTFIITIDESGNIISTTSTSETKKVIRFKEI